MRHYAPSVPGILYTWFGVNVVLVVVGLYLFWKRRNIFPCERRGLVELAVMNVAAIVNALNYPFLIQSCLLNYACFMLATIILLVWLTRTWRLLFHFQLQATFFKLGQAREDNKSDKKAMYAAVALVLDGWWVRHRSLGGWKVIAVSICALMCTLVVMICASLAVSEGRIVDAPTGTICRGYDYGLLYWFTTIVIAVELLVGLFLSCRLHGFAADAYRLKSELITTGVSLISTLVLYQIVHLGIPSLDRYGVPEFLGICGLFVMCVTSLWWPLSLTRTSKTHALRTQLILRSKLAARDVDFEAFLASPDSRASWQEFLKSEFSLENILFYDAVNLWKRTHFEAPSRRASFRSDSGTTHSDTHEETKDSRRNIQLGVLSSTPPPQPQQILDQAISDCLFIIANFLVQGAHAQVNVPGSIRAKVEVQTRESLSALSMAALRILLDEAAREIYLLMENDSWPRYRHSALYQALLETRAAHPVARLDSVLVVSGSSTETGERRSVSLSSHRRHARSRSTASRQSIARSRSAVGARFLRSTQLENAPPLPRTHRSFKSTLT